MTRFSVAVPVTTLVVGYALGAVFHTAPGIAAQTGGRVFEIRTYYTHEGKLDALNARFRNHTVGLFTKHGMTNIGYWTPQDGPMAGNTLIYILAHDSRDAAKKSWDAFRADPDWQKARSESEAAGPIVSKIDSVFLQATDYSPLK
jgi:NIPSNAP